MKKFTLLLITIMLFSFSGCDPSAFDDFTLEEDEVTEDRLDEEYEDDFIEGEDFYYVEEDAEACETIRFRCEEGYEPFFVAAGCGCEKTLDTIIDEMDEFEDEFDEDTYETLSYTTETIEEETPTYIVEVTYPIFDGYPQVNSFIKDRVDSSIDLLIEEVYELELTEEVIDEFMTTKSSLYSDFTIYQANENYISLYFMNSVYWAGAAHPNSYTDVVNYDLVNDEQLILMDFFAPDSNYWDALSYSTISALNENLYEDEFAMDDWIETGASPDPDNFQAFTFDEDGFTIHFDPYVVAPYAAGPQRVEVPFDDVYAILLPEWSE